MLFYSPDGAGGDVKGVGVENGFDPTLLAFSQPGQGVQETYQGFNPGLGRESGQQLNMDLGGFGDRRFSTVSNQSGNGSVGYQGDRRFSSASTSGMNMMPMIPQTPVHAMQQQNQQQQQQTIQPQWMNLNQMQNQAVVQDTTWEDQKKALEEYLAQSESSLTHSALY
jgi:hypothetical protein